MEMFKSSRNTGSINVVAAGAWNVNMECSLSRHPNLSGMTTFHVRFPLKNLDCNHSSEEMDKIQLVPVQDILKAEGLPKGKSHRLCLLRLDAEGFELRALEGLNITAVSIPILHI